MAVRERGATWEQSPSWACNPMTPAKRETLRAEVERKQQNLAVKSSQRLAMYQTRREALGAPTPLDVSQFASSPRAHDLVALPGQRQSLPTNVVDRHVPNVNALRYSRHAHYSQAIPRDGGRSYTSTLTENWVEERRDRDYTPGWHPKELRLNRLWDTEHTANFTAPDSAYASRTATLNAVALPPPTSPKSPQLKDREHNSAKLIHYGVEGFGAAPRQDHTSPPKRGGYWVGVAPLREGESITTTAHGRREHLEFQTRSATDDPKTVVLGTVCNHPDSPNNTRPRDRWTSKAYTDLYDSQRHTSTWRSMYNRDFKDFSLRSPTLRTPPLGTGLGRPATSQTVHLEPLSPPLSLLRTRPLTALD